MARDDMIHKRTLQSVEYDKIIQIFADLCQSPPAHSRALSLQPFASPEDADAAIERYNEAQNWLAWLAPRKFSLATCPDLSPLINMMAKKAKGHLRHMQPDLENFWALRETLNIAFETVASLANESGIEKWPTLRAVYGNAELPVKLHQALNRCVSDNGSINDESSPELLRVRNEIRSLHQSCLRKVKDLVQQYNMAHYLQDDFMTLSSDRYVLPLKANFKGRMQGIIHDWSQTGETCYFEPVFLVEINNRLQELKHEEKEEEKRILQYLAELLQTELEPTIFAYDMLVELDILQAKVQFAALLQARAPAFGSADEGVELINARHPLLVLDRLPGKSSSASPARPLSIILRQDEKGLVLTGGNAGGKTVCLKTLGLIACMAMSALPIPVDAGSHLPWFDRMDAFIGDEQSLADNVSTFTAQIDHLAKAWKHLNASGCVLLDEFGSGTDPAEGAALSQAVLDGLREKQCYFLCATHFPALKSYALSHAGVRAASMLFNPKTGQPLFTIAYDQVGSSQALEVAEKHGLPESIISRAKHYLLQDGEDSSQIISRLNTLAHEREMEIQSLSQKESRLEAEYRDKTTKLEKDREKLQKEIASRISELMQAWKSGRSGAKQTLKEFSGLRRELGLESSRKTSLLAGDLPDQIETGKPVFHTGLNKTGIVTEIDERRKKLRLDLNGVGIWANMEDVRASNANASLKAPAAAIKGNVEHAASLSVDVRGKRADDAIAEVSRFIDRAILSGFGEVEIVHGKGTGALRKEIRSFLKTFPAISHVASAPEDRGGDGMTIVTLN